MNTNRNQVIFGTAGSLLVVATLVGGGVVAAGNSGSAGTTAAAPRQTYQQCMADPRTIYQQCQTLPDAPVPTPSPTPTYTVPTPTYTVPTPTPPRTTVPEWQYGIPLVLDQGDQPNVGSVKVTRPYVSFHDPTYSTYEYGKPDHGEYLIFKVTVTATAGNTFNTGSWDFKVQLNDGSQYTTTYAGFEPAFPSGEVEGGSFVTGNVVFDLPLNAHGHLLYDPTSNTGLPVAKWTF